MEKRFNLIIAIIILLMSCSERETRNVTFFKNTVAYDLAKAVDKEDLDEIEKLLDENPKLLDITNDVSGSNVLSLALTLEKFKSFKKLLDLGSNPNFVNTISKRSVLIDACRFYDKPEAYTLDLRYIKLLLDKGADPNYAVENDFTDQEGNYHMATSPLHEASQIDLKMVKILINAGADPFFKLEQDQSTPFSNSLQGGSNNKFDVANYFIDSLNVNLTEPISIHLQQPTNAEVLFYIQDEIVNTFTLAKINNNTREIDKLIKENSAIEDVNAERWKLIEKLERLGVDFKNHKYIE